MQISSANPNLAASLTALAAGPDKGGSAIQEAPTPPKAAPAPASAAEPTPAAESAKISISAGAQAQVATHNPPAPVYAEIWQGAMKVAQVDIHGQVTSYSALIASGGGGLAGPLLAAQRAVQVAQQTGGEIRSAGQSLDGQTLLNRARLASTYLG